MASKLLNAMKNTVGQTLTENGALTFDKTGSKVLDFYSKGGAMRTRSEQDILKVFKDAFDENPLLALKTLFYLRDIRQGQGERNLVRICLKWLAKTHPDVFIKNIDNVVEFGRFDDLFVAIEILGRNEGYAKKERSKVSEAVLSFVKKQLAADARQKDDTKLSLLAKWMPSSNTSGKGAKAKATRVLAYEFINYLKISPRKYRKTLSNLRTRLKVVEKMISANEWGQVNFEHVPSKANLLYRKAFSRHQPERYTAFIKSVEKGDAKINSSALYPYEVIRECAKGASTPEALNALWNALPDFLKDNPHNGLVLPDVSGSMTSCYGRTVMPIWVSVSLAIYFAQRSKGIFAKHFLEFSSTSKLVQLNSEKIVDAWNEVRHSTTWCGSTNLQSAFDAILNAAVQHKISQKDMVDVLYVVSDMEYDQAISDNSKTNFEVIKEKFKKAGYKMPSIVFWNVSARNDQSPVTKDEKGIVLVSGCSPTIFSQVISNKNVTPYDFMLETLNKPRYNSVVV